MDKMNMPTNKNDGKNYHKKDFVPAQNDYKRKKQGADQNKANGIAKRSRYLMGKEAIQRRAIAKKIDFGGDIDTMAELLNSSSPDMIKKKRDGNAYPLQTIAALKTAEKERAIEALAKIASHMKTKVKNKGAEFAKMKKKKDGDFFGIMNVKQTGVNRKQKQPLKNSFQSNRDFNSISLNNNRFIVRKKGKKNFLVNKNSNKNKKDKKRRRKRGGVLDLKYEDMKEFFISPSDIERAKLAGVKINDNSNLKSNRSGYEDRYEKLDFIDQNYQSHQYTKYHNGSRFLLGKSKYLKKMDDKIKKLSTPEHKNSHADKLLIIKQSKDLLSINRYHSPTSEIKKKKKTQKIMPKKMPVPKMRVRKILNCSPAPSTKKLFLPSTKKHRVKAKGKSLDPRKNRLVEVKSANEPTRDRIKPSRSLLHGRKQKVKTKSKSKSYDFDAIRNIGQFNNSFNILNLVCIKYEEEDLNSRLKYFVGRGNNQNLVSRHIQDRRHVGFTPFFNQSQFVWTQTSKQKHKISKFSDFSDTKTDAEMLAKFFKSQNMFEVGNDIVSESVAMSQNFPTSSISVSKLNLFNHVQGVKHLGRKQLMTIHISNHCKEKGIKLDSIVPKTFLINTKTCESDLMDCIQGIKKDSHQFSIPWIIKPGEFSNRGKGIEMAFSEEEIEPKVRKLLENRKGNVVLVQKYLNDPVLFKKRKFDLRCYALVIIMPHKLTVFWYKQGYARTSSYEYQIDDKKNLMVHLTNEAVQVKSKY